MHLSQIQFCKKSKFKNKQKKKGINLVVTWWQQLSYCFVPCHMEVVHTVSSAQWDFSGTSGATLIVIILCFFFCIYCYCNDVIL